MIEKRVAIIGAGVSGLTSAKYALEYGLKPIVFEKSPQISGLWSARDTAIPQGMRTNSTKYSLILSDHMLPSDTKLFLPSYDVDQYLIEYAEKFELTQHIRLNHQVEHVKALKDEGENETWEVYYRNLLTDELNSDIFDYVIVATGPLPAPYMPNDVDSSVFKGQIYHSSQVKIRDPRLKSKRVVVIGGSISATDVSGHLVGHAASVTHVFRRSPLILPLLWKIKLEANKYFILPYDAFLSTRFLTYPSCDMTPDEIKYGFRMLMKNMAAFQADENPKCPEALHVDFDNPDEKLILTLSDTYLDDLKEGKITPIKSSIREYVKNGIYLKNGQFIEADVVVYCTGYKWSLERFLDKRVLEAIKYNETNRHFPAIMYKETFVPEFRTIAMTGLIQTNFFGYEMQARWINSVFSGRIEFPHVERMRKYIRNLEQKRNSKTAEICPYGSVVNMIDNYAEELGLKPDLDEVKENSPKLFDRLWNDTVCVSHYFYDKQNEEYFAKILKEVRGYKTKLYELNPIESKIKQSEVIEQFRKYYKY